MDAATAAWERRAMQVSRATLAPTVVAFVTLGVMVAFLRVLQVPVPPSDAPAELRSIPAPIVDDPAAPPTAPAPEPSRRPQPSLPRPAEVVTAYYAALDARRFEEAWRTLSPAVRRSFGGFAAWRAGYATTRSSRPVRLDVSTDGGTATVEHLLETVDRMACGLARRTFTVRWRLTAAEHRWTAQALTGAALAAGPARCAAHG